ncbi:MAG: hypothetical protein IT529_18145 [Burkholderiales bacterium]|nr:hypothetical protein [Burkholderiales bacterium]
MSHVTLTQTGTTEADLNVETLKNLEQWLVQTTLQKARANYAKQGFDPKTFQPKINVGSVYTLAGGKKLAVIKMSMDGQVRTVWVLGFHRGEFLRVTCVRGSNHDISIFSGECGQKITEAFGVSIKPQVAQQEVVSGNWMQYRMTRRCRSRRLDPCQVSGSPCAVAPRRFWIDDAGLKDAA